MPWSAPTVSELRTAFVHAVRTAGLSVAAACRRFGSVLPASLHESSRLIC
jgi:hypothetical protein